MTPQSPWTRRWSSAWLAAALLIALFAGSLASPVSAQDESAEDAMTISLEEVNNSGVSGTVRLTPNGDQTDVAVRLTGATGSHPNHIHENYCANADPAPLAPLSHIVIGETDPDGFTHSMVDMSVDELLAGEFSIIVHLSDDELDQYLACGNIAAEGEAEQVPAEMSPGTTTDDGGPASGSAAVAGSTDSSVTGVATTGVGSGVQPDLRLILGLVSLALLSAAVSLGVARRMRLN